MTLPGCRLHLFALVHLALMFLLARNAHGQIVYDPEAYRQLAAAVATANAAGWNQNHPPELAGLAALSAGGDASRLQWKISNQDRRRRGV